MYSSLVGYSTGRCKTGRSLYRLRVGVGEGEAGFFAPDVVGAGVEVEGDLSVVVGGAAGDCGGRGVVGGLYPDGGAGYGRVALGCAGQGVGVGLCSGAEGGGVGQAGAG
jgi:hypothetical protein